MLVPKVVLLSQHRRHLEEHGNTIPTSAAPSDRRSDGNSGRLFPGNEGRLGGNFQTSLKLSPEKDDKKSEV